MARPDLEVVGQPRDPLQAGEQRASRGLHRSGTLRGSLEQVGTAHVTNEQKVSGDRCKGLVQNRRVRHQERQVLGGMTRRMQDLDANAADIEPIAIV